MTTSHTININIACLSGGGNCLFFAPPPLCPPFVNLGCVPSLKPGSSKSKATTHITFLLPTPHPPTLYTHTVSLWFSVAGNVGSSRVWSGAGHMFIWQDSGYMGGTRWVRYVEAFVLSWTFYIFLVCTIYSGTEERYFTRHRVTLGEQHYSQWIVRAGGEGGGRPPPPPLTKSHPPLAKSHPLETLTIQMTSLYSKWHNLLCIKVA